MALLRWPSGRWQHALAELAKFYGGPTLQTRTKCVRLHTSWSERWPDDAAHGINVQAKWESTSDGIEWEPVPESEELATLRAENERLRNAARPGAQPAISASRSALVALDPSVDMTQPIGRMVANILVAVAQWESEMIGVRTADAMAQGKARGYGRARMTPPAVVRLHRAATRETAA